MNFQAPLMLLWFLPVGGFILALYLLRMKRKNLTVPASFLWPERKDEIRANSLFQRLRFSWLWVLQLLALAALVLSLARWQIEQKNVLGRNTVIVLDSSASMLATDVSPSRFDAARQRALDLASSMRAGDSVAVIEAGATPRVLAGLSNDPSRVANAVRQARASDAPGDMGEALRLAGALVGSGSGAQIVLLSDGCFDPVQDVPAGMNVQFEPFGQSGANLAIHALGTGQTPSGLQTYVGVKNYGAEPAPTVLSIYADGKVQWSQQVVVPPQGTIGRTVTIPAKTQIVEARLGSGGALAADDRRLTPANVNGSIRTLLITRGNLFLETGLVLDPRVVLDKAATVPSSERANSPGRGEYDLVLFDSIPEVPVKAATVVSFGAASEVSPVVGSGTARQGNLIEHRATGILDGVSFENVYFEKIFKVQPRPGAKVLASSQAGPLVVERAGAQKQIYFAFDLLDGDFPLSVSFPILLGNLIDLVADAGSRQLTSLTTGQRTALPAPDTAVLNIAAPDGREISIPAVNGRYSLRALDQVGIYTAGKEEDRRTFLVNLVSETESNIAPKKEIALGSSQTTVVARSPRFADLWKPLIIAMLLILSLEWLMYVRRS